MNHLYTYLSCPFSQVIRIALTEANIDFEHIISKFNNIPKQVLDVCSRGDSPVLFHNETAYVGIYAIRNLIDNITLNKFTHQNHPEIYRLLFLIEHYFTFEVMYPIYYSKILSKKISASEIQEGYKNLNIHLNHLNWLSSKDYFLYGRKISWVDIVATGFILCLDYLSLIKWHEYPSLKSWYMKIKSRKSVILTIRDFRIIGYKPPMHYLELDF